MPVYQNLNIPAKSITNTAAASKSATKIRLHSDFCLMHLIRSNIPEA